jgi:hypothetical protein
MTSAPVTRPHSHSSRKASANTRGYVLPLVFLLVLVGTALTTVILSRRGQSRLAMERQSDAYVSHHMQLGVRDLTAVIMFAARRQPDYLLSKGELAYSLELEGGMTVDVRMRDAGGAVKMTDNPGTSIRMNMLARAVSVLNDKGLLNARNTNVRQFVRGEGSPRISLHTAPREVLEALAMAVDPDGDAKGFATAIIDARKSRNIPLSEVRTLCAGPIAPNRIELMEQMLITEPNLWWVQCLVKDSTGRAIVAQGGLMEGSLSARTSGAAGAGLPGGGPAQVGWNVLQWGPLPKGGLPAFREPVENN